MQCFNGRLNIKACRWPWQSGYDWKGMTSSNTLFGTRRFGAGWGYKLGISLSGFSSKGSLAFELIFGLISIGWDFRPERERQANREALNELIVRVAEWRKDDGTEVTF